MNLSAKKAWNLAAKLENRARVLRNAVHDFARDQDGYTQPAHAYFVNKVKNSDTPIIIPKKVIK